MGKRASSTLKRCTKNEHPNTHAHAHTHPHPHRHTHPHTRKESDRAKASITCGGMCVSVRWVNSHVSLPPTPPPPPLSSLPPSPPPPPPPNVRKHTCMHTHTVSLIQSGASGVSLANVLPNTLQVLAMSAVDGYTQVPRTQARFTLH